MAYNEQTYEQRMKQGGDPAENQFRVYAKQHKISIEHYGFDRSKLKRFTNLPGFVRMTPDFACTKGSDGFLVECKGVGATGVFKLKAETLDELETWNNFCPVYVFLNDSFQQQIALLPLSSIITYLVENGVKTQVFKSDGKEYYPVPVSVFSWQDAATEQETQRVLKKEKEDKWRGLIKMEIRSLS